MGAAFSDYIGLVSVFHNVFKWTIYELPAIRSQILPHPLGQCQVSSFFHRKSKMAEENFHSTDSSVSVKKIIQQFY